MMAVTKPPREKERINVMATDVPMEAPHEAEERNMSRLGCVNVVQCVTMETCVCNSAMNGIHRRVVSK